MIRTERILLVDDEPQVLVALEDLLGDDYVVLSTGVPEKALEWIVADATIAVIICDERMPGLAGSELFGRIGDRSRAARILLTGYADISSVVRAVNDGNIFAYVDKPWVDADLRDKVRKAADQFRALQDASEREAALRRESLRFKALMEASPAPSLVIDQSGRITFVNRAIERLLGFDRGELEGQLVERLLPDADRARHPGLRQSYASESDARTMASGRDIFAVRKDETSIPVEIGLSPVQLPDGPATLACIVDLSRQKRDEHELRRSNLELEQFAYVASHDLQEPLRIIASFAQLLDARHRTQLGEDGTRYLGHIHEAASRMRRLVSDVLKYSQVGSHGAEREVTRFSDLVASAVASLQRAIEETDASIQIGDLPSLCVDASLFVQVFQNLLGNAIKFRSEAPPRVRVEATHDRGLWTFSVTDNGLGMSMLYAERVFQMFQRLHDRGRFAGSGIGLAIVKRIVEQHGGRAWLDSEPGRGTTACFTVPEAAQLAPGP